MFPAKVYLNTFENGRYPEESNKHSVKDLLLESLSHEEKAINFYRELLDSSENKSLYVEEYAREMIKTEEMHSIEIKKMLKDYD